MDKKILTTIGIVVATAFIILGTVCFCLHKDSTEEDREDIVIENKKLIKTAILESKNKNDGNNLSGDNSDEESVDVDKKSV